MGRVVPFVALVVACSSTPTDPYKRYWTEIELPIARTAVEDLRVQPYYRLDVTLDRHGRMLLGERLIAPDALRALIATEVERYDERMRIAGGSGFEEFDGARFSRIYVCVGVDRRVPWGDVAPVLAAIGDAGVYRLMFEARRTDVSAAVFHVFLPSRLAAPAPPPVFVHRGSFEPKGTFAPSAEGVVAIRPDADATIQDVVAAIDALAGASRIEKFDLHPPGATTPIVVRPVAR